MNNTEYFGKRDISSHFSRCDSCRRLTLLNSYSTTRFIRFLRIFLFPAGRFRMIDECPHCGFRGTVSLRKYARERERNLELMMDGFASAADDPRNCAHALHTLMIYDQHSWFHDVQKSYGLRFENHVEIQFLLAQGLCRFGDYKEAMTYCRKAIVQNAGKAAEDLLAFCQHLIEDQEAGKNPEEFAIQPESSLKAYIPIGTVAVVLALCSLFMGISSLSNYRAWLINGSLRQYSFMLDNNSYTLGPGDCKQITLRLGEHHLKYGTAQELGFTYTIPMIKQLMEKHTLVINPDAMGLFAVSTDSDEMVEYFQGNQIYLFPDLSSPLNSISRDKEWHISGLPLIFYRPETHMAMVRFLHEHLNQTDAASYARRALAMDPALDETSALLKEVIRQGEDDANLAFLQSGLAITPTLLPWHIEYQNYMMIHHPDHNLEREYTLRCKNLPLEAESYYLLGRVVKDRAAAYQFFEHVESLPHMKGEGYQAIAHNLYIRGQFAEALSYSQKAVACNATNAVFLSLNEQLHMALREYNELIEHIKTAPSNLSTTEQEKRTILYLSCAGFHHEAEAEVVRLCQDRPERLPELNAVRFYAVGNITDYLACLSEAGTGHAQMEALLHNDRIEEAERLILEEEIHPYWEHLVLYSAAMNQGRMDIADNTFKKGVAEAGHDTPGRHHLSEILSDNAQPTIEAIRNLDIDAQEKAILCVALGYRYPDLKQPLFKLAEKYNFNRIYPQLLLKKWLRASTSKPTHAPTRDHQNIPEPTT